MERGFRVMSTREERWPAFDRAVFRTITDADWAAALPRARAWRNGVSEQIRAGAGDLKKNLNPTIGKLESRETGKLNVL